MDLRDREPEKPGRTCPGRKLSIAFPGSTVHSISSRRDNDQSFIESLIRYGNLLNNEKSSTQQSLFGESDTGTDC